MLAAQFHLPQMAASRNQATLTYHVPQVHTLHLEPEAIRRYDARGLTYAQHEMLRQRKTPQGIMIEESDMNAENNIHAHPSKHVLLSRSPDNYRNSAEPRSRYGAQSDIRAGGHDVNHTLHPQDLKIQTPPWEISSGMDSVLHQTTPPYGARYHLYPGCQVPTVLPSALNARLGPTASAGQQYYGPYWPDGTYTPYRPAPVRDSRFFDRNHSFNDFQRDLHQDNRTLRRSGRLPDSQNLHDLLQERHYQAPPPGQISFNEGVHSQPTYFKNIGWQGARPLNIYETSRGHAPSSVDANMVPLSLIRPEQSSDRIAFRDRTFTWAHRIYVELLARVQRESRLTRTPGLGRAFHKPAIFPKPPQRSRSHFKEEAGGANRVEKPRSQPAANSSTNPSNIMRLANPRALDDGMALSPSSYHLSSLPEDSRRHDDVRRGSDPSHYSNEFPSQSPPGTAFSAFDTMELLCREADKPWTDGMLLAGCLAYGLGNYTKALMWYQKILTQDSDHVEARSNAAATLLALNRRDEALQYWYTAVKHRPSYFEAVEHLVGLLCSTQRAREAVDIIEFVELSLRLSDQSSAQSNNDSIEDDSDTLSRTSSTTTTASTDAAVFDYDVDRRTSVTSLASSQQAPGFGSSGFAIPGADNGRILALIHAKGNMLYALGDNVGAAASFENAILIATGKQFRGMTGLISQILSSCVSSVSYQSQPALPTDHKEPILLSPERAQQTAQRMFSPSGELPGLEFVPNGLAQKAAISTTSNSLLSLAKIYQDGMSNPGSRVNHRSNGTREILALYYLSLSLQRSPSTANNVGILLASVPQPSNIQVVPQCHNNEIINYSGIVPGSGIDLALRYYNYGLSIDPRHAHLYTNLGSLLKDLGHLGPAIRMYTKAVEYDPKFDIALANLANAVKDQGRIADAITYYRRAVQANPDFAEAVCGLATALNSVCNWYGRGGIYADKGKRDRIHVDDYGMMHEARRGFGWINRVVEIVEKQLKDGEFWGIGTLTQSTIEQLCRQLATVKAHASGEAQVALSKKIRKSLIEWSGKKWEGARIVRLIERAVRQIGWQWYQDRYKHGKEYSTQRYARPTLPVSLSSPTAPTVLPFHTFTTPLSAKQVRQISQRNALRISVSTLRSSWLPSTVYAPPHPPTPCLRVGYVSSDFNNHPLAHLMQSIFGFHDQNSVRAYCYATTSSDASVHRKQIEQESPVFHDASTWSVERLVNQVVEDGIHILVNLNGYTRGARNEVFAARPAPIHMSFMGFAGTLGAEWCDYVFADSISLSTKTLSPHRSNVSIEDRLHHDALVEEEENWMYAENVIFAKSTFFCVDHKQSSPDAKVGPPPLHDRCLGDAAWHGEQQRRWRMRKELFPNLSDTAIVFGNFNQLYKIDPSTYRLYLRILAGVPNAILWLLRFPDVGEQNLLNFAREWAGPEVASRVVFTDVAPKDQHITRASVVDLFLDTPECNAHTTAADVIWSGTPILTWARWEYKMCSRMASSIVASAFAEGRDGDEARADLLVSSEEEYEQRAIRLALDLRYSGDGVPDKATGRLLDLRRMLWEGRWTSRLFDTRRWVRDLETAYWKAWTNWEQGRGGDIWL